jgi:predicted ATPase/DNA-binding SARP family transcriptional activator
MDFRILGTFEVVGTTGQLRVRGAKRRGLLACLVVHAGHPLRTDLLVHELWGERAPDGAFHTVQTYVSQLRKLLEDGARLETRPGGYALEIAPTDVDAQRFERAVSVASQSREPALLLAGLDEALAWWRGPPLAEFAGAGWADRETTRLEAIRLDALKRRHEALLALDRAVEAVTTLEPLVHLHPLDEGLWAQLMLALYRSGRQGDALRAYQHARTNLANELGIEPGPELADLERRILDHDPTLLVRAKREEAALERDPQLTFLFTDIEESTRLWADFPDTMPRALEAHDAILDDAVGRHGGTVLKRTGDGVTAVFTVAVGALHAAIAAQRALAGTAWPTAMPVQARMGIHSGSAIERDGDYYGMAPNMTARLRDAGHGGQTLLSDAAVQAIPELPEDVSLDLVGVHRLRGIPGVHRVHQVRKAGLQERFPPLRTLDAAAAVTVPATSFHGRKDELTRLSELVARPGAVTLVGPGGVGKTRLAVELVAETAHRFRDGARVVDLAPIDPDGVPAAVAEGLGLVRRGERSFRASVLDWLANKHLLLVVDNCEHVVDAVGHLVREALEATSELTVICTSRQTLGFPGEVIFRVEPLCLPAGTGDAAGASPAVRLFTDRAAAARGGQPVEPAEVHLVAEICRRLDGIPLALELAAGRARSVGLRDLLAHMHTTSPLLATQVPDHPRHRTLLSTVQWSYDLLPPETRSLFDRLSVFSGAWTVGAAFAICGDDHSAEDVLSLLADLADRSMIVAEFGAGESRYRMLSTLRDFAAGRLAATEGTAEVRSRHAVFYRDFAERAGAGLLTADEASWAREVAADFGNLRAAHLWALDNADVDLDARLLVALWDFGLQRLSAEYFRWVDEAFVRLSFEDCPLVPDLHGIAALGAWLRGDLGQCLRACQAAFDAEQRLGSGLSLPARMAVVVAAAYAPPGQPADPQLRAEAPTRFLEVVARSRELGEPFWLVYSMVNGALGLVMAGELERAAALASRALRVARESARPTSLAWALFGLATALEQPEPERCQALLEEGVGLARVSESRMVLGLSVSLLATVHRRLGRPVDAVPLLLELLDHCDRLGNRPLLWHTIREAAMCLGELRPDETGVRLLSAVDHASLVMPVLPADRDQFATLRRHLRDAVGDGTFDAATLAGADLTRQEAVVLATRSLAELQDFEPEPAT